MAGFVRYSRRSWHYNEIAPTEAHLYMELSQILGWIATFMFSIMIVPQMVKTIKSKDTHGVSLLLFVIFLIANVIALTYSIMIEQSPLIIKYCIAIITTITYILIFLYYYNKKKSIDCREHARLHEE
jgi:MtN3 and saliva related transmembrane protein